MTDNTEKSSVSLSTHTHTHILSSLLSLSPSLTHSLTHSIISSLWPPPSDLDRYTQTSTQSRATCHEGRHPVGGDLYAVLVILLPPSCNLTCLPNSHIILHISTTSGRITRLSRFFILAHPVFYTPLSSALSIPGHPEDHSDLWAV